MAKFLKIDQNDVEEFLKDRPDIIRELNKKLPTDELYRIKSSGAVGTLFSYNEDGTVTIILNGEYGMVLIAQMVSVEPDDIEVADIPDGDETTGVIISSREDTDFYKKWFMKRVEEGKPADSKLFLDTHIRDLASPNLEVVLFKDTKQYKDCIEANK